jgi:hypothetical protein
MRFIYEETVMTHAVHDDFVVTPAERVAVARGEIRERHAAVQCGVATRRLAQSAPGYRVGHAPQSANWSVVLWYTEDWVMSRAPREIYAYLFFARLRLSMPQYLAHPVFSNP